MLYLLVWSTNSDASSVLRWKMKASRSKFINNDISFYLSLDYSLFLHTTNCKSILTKFKNMEDIWKRQTHQISKMNQIMNLFRLHTNGRLPAYGLGRIASQHIGSGPWFFFFCNYKTWKMSRIMICKETFKFTKWDNWK